MRNLQDLKNKLFERSGFREEYYKKDEDFEVALMVTKARIALELTQKELAKRVGTKQPSIARLESGSCTPSVKFLREVASALNLNLDIRFSDMRGVGISVHEIESQMEPGIRDTVSVSSQGAAQHNINRSY